MLTVVKALIAGLEHTYQNQGIGGMASAAMVLEIIHTHYWEKDAHGSNRSDTSNPSLVRYYLYINLYYLKYRVTVLLIECES